MAVLHERRLLGQVLLDEGLVTQEQLDEGLNQQARYGGAFGRVLVVLGKWTREEWLLALGQQAGMEVVDLDHLDVEDEVVKMISPSVSNIYRIVPISFDNGVLTVAMADPMNVNALDDLRFLLDCEVQGAVEY